MTRLREEATPGQVPTDPLPPGYVLHPPQLKARAPLRHPLGPAMIVPASLSISGFEQHEKTCANCGAVRATIVGGPIARVWRIHGDNEQRPFEPACGPIGGA